jgi:hypothetical protein
VSRRLLAPLLVVAALVAGIWFWAGVVAPGYWSAILLALAWLVACGVAVGRITQAAPALRLPLGGAFLACLVAAVAGFYAAFVRHTVADETIVSGVPQSRATAGATTAGLESRQRARTRTNVVELLGAVTRKAPTGAGIARVVRFARARRRLTLSDGFEVSPAPRVHVRLATDAGSATFKDLGGLKGSKGDQQYEIPVGLPLSVYDTVVFWCVPLSQTLASAELAPA